MPVLMQIYVIFMIIMLLVNAWVWMKFGGKLWVLAYELLSGAYLLLLIFAYWYPQVRACLSAWNVIPFAALLACDFYLSMWAKVRDFSPALKDASEKELEFSKAVSVLMASPGYVVGVLLSIELLKPVITG